jgi:hypothetical protein
MVSINVNNLCYYSYLNCCVGGYNYAVSNFNTSCKWKDHEWNDNAIHVFHEDGDVNVCSKAGTTWTYISVKSWIAELGLYIKTQAENI